MSRIIINGQDYLIGPMDVFDQLNIARRITPMAPVIEGIMDPSNTGKDTSVLVILMLARLSDDDSSYVVKKCLSVTSILQGDKWASMMTKQGILMFNDLSMKDMIDITTAVIVEHLGDFFHIALSAVAEGAAP